MSNTNSTRIKRLSYRLGSGELRELASWMEKRANKVWQLELIAEMKAYPVGSRVVLGHTSYKEFSGQVVTVVKQGPKRIHVKNEAGGVLTIPHTAYYMVKGPPSKSNIELAKTEIEVDKQMKGMLDSLFT